MTDDEKRLTSKDERLPSPIAAVPEPAEALPEPAEVPRGTGAAPPKLAARQADGQRHIEFLTHPRVGSGVALIDTDGQCLLLMAIDTSAKMPLDEPRRMQIAGAIEQLYKACRGWIEPDRILLPGRPR